VEGLDLSSSAGLYLTIQILEGVDESGVRAVCFNVRDLKNRPFQTKTVVWFLHRANEKPS
jgi:hypothetical protein